MAKTKEFIIPFKGLGLGFHEFTFEVSKKFFEEIEYSEIKNGSINVGLALEKQETMMVFNFTIDGEIGVNCDRCLEPFDYLVNGQQQLIVQFGESYKEETDEIIIIPENEYEFNIAPIIYEYIYLLKPIQCIHPDDDEGYTTCNSEVMDKLNNINSQEQTDPRWDALKELKEE